MVFCTPQFLRLLLPLYYFLFQFFCERISVAFCALLGGDLHNYGIFHFSIHFIWLAIATLRHFPATGLFFSDQLFAPCQAERIKQFSRQRSSAIPAPGSSLNNEARDDFFVARVWAFNATRWPLPLTRVASDTAGT